MELTMYHQFDARVVANVVLELSSDSVTEFIEATYRISNEDKRSDLE